MVSSILKARPPRAATRAIRLAAAAIAINLLMAAPDVRAEAAAATPAVSPKPLERQLEVHLSLQGDQAWQNLLQSTQATTAQDYNFGTRMRSDGVLYGDNLLDMDQKARLEIKQQYYARLGLLRLKRDNGGKLPQSAGDLQKFLESYQTRSKTCFDDYGCNQEAIERYAALNSLKQNKVEDLEAFLADPGGENPRFLYFFGYAGCPTHIHITYTLHIAGMRAFDREGKRLVPVSLDRNADSKGNDVDNKMLCERYVATVDTKNGAVFLENLYRPQPLGTTVRTINGSVERIEEELPAPAELDGWATAKLRQTRDSGSVTEKLRITLPLDHNSTVGGKFDGELSLTMSWSFKPVVTAPLK